MCAKDFSAIRGCAGRVPKCLESDDLQLQIQHNNNKAIITALSLINCLTSESSKTNKEIIWYGKNTTP